MGDSAELLPGTLDLLILKAVSLGQLHGYGVLLRIGQISGDALQIQQGALYPALYRLEHQGLIDSEWGTSENNRRAKYYRPPAAGRARRAEATGSGPPRAPGADRRGVGDVGEHPAGQVLPPHGRRSRAARRGDGELEPPRG